MQIVLTDKMYQYLKILFNNKIDFIEVIKYSSDEIIAKVSVDDSIEICERIMDYLQDQGLLEEDSITEETYFIESIFDIFNKDEE